MKIINTIILLFSLTMAEDVPFKVGESLKYSAEFNMVPVGVAELNVTAIESINNKPGQIFALPDVELLIVKSSVSV